MNRRSFLKTSSLAIFGVTVGIPGLFLSKSKSDAVEVGDLKQFHVAWYMNNKDNYVDRDVKPALLALHDKFKKYKKRGYLSLKPSLKDVVGVNKREFKYNGMYCNYIEVGDIVNFKVIARIDISIGKPV